MDLLIRDENYNEIFASTGFGPTPPFNSNEKLFIGFGNNGNSYFDGWIDELRISNKKREYRDDIIAEINTNDFKDSVPPMLRDRWTVYYPPITKYFPIDTITGERYKGNSCGMTIMIRLLHYWEHPRFPSGNIDYWFGPVHWQADLDNTEYLYDLMPNKFGPNPTEEEYGPSALFAQQVSAVTRIYYDAMSSFPQFLDEYFHYKKGMKLYFRHQFTKEEWIKIFKNELSHGRPIMTAGLEEVFDEGGAAGHYYIVDGYNAEGKFHSDESFGDVDFWVDIDSFPYGKFQTIMIGAEPDWYGKTLTLNYPKGGECRLKETELEIKWDSENIDNVLLEYSSDAGKTWQTISNNIQAHEGSFLWTLPGTFSKNYKVRISDTEDGNIYRRSNTFVVVNKQEIAFEYPINNTYFQAGSNQPLYWSSEGVKAFKLEYSTDGENWTLLEDSIVSALGRYEIRIPQLESETVRLKATNIDDESIFVISEIFKVKGNGLLGGPFIQDENAVLLMHFEESLKNNAPNNLQAIEANSSGTYIENYAQHLGKAFQFNNDETLNNFLIVPHESELDLTGSWTIEMWFNTNSLNAVLINKPSDTGENYNVHIEGDGHMEARFYDSDGVRHQIGTPSATIQTNKLYHITFTNDISSHTLELTIRNEDVNVIFNQTLSYPAGSIPGTGTGDLTIGNLVDGYIDELRIMKTAISHTETAVLNTSLVTNFSCYPNPVTNESIISFQTKTSGNVNLSVFDLQGRKICTLLEEKLSAGSYSYSLGKTISSEGVYFLRLKTQEGISTQKIIYMKE
jgi:hypothetical protein